MCFSFSVTLLLVLTGSLVARSRIKKKEYNHALIVLFYTLMETLQAIQYFFLQHCDWFNQVLTYGAHFLIILQPALWNFFRYRTSTKNKPLFFFALEMSLVWAFFFSLRFFSYSFQVLEPTLNKGDILVGEKVCTFAGSTHLYWTFPYYSYGGLEANLFTYLLLWFYPALYEEKGVIKLLMWLGQIVLIFNLVTLSKELPSFWCALSVPFLALGTLVY